MIFLDLKISHSNSSSLSYSIVYSSINDLAFYLANSLMSSLNESSKC